MGILLTKTIQIRKFRPKVTNLFYNVYAARFDLTGNLEIVLFFR